MPHSFVLTPRTFPGVPTHDPPQWRQLENHVSTSFADLGVPTDLVHRLAELGITEPFPIQRKTIADALRGRDLCGKAPTGSGKTLAFALPIAMRVGRARPGNPRALVLVPTRELATQVSETILPLAQVTHRKVATFYGGTSLNRDRQRLRGRVDVAVATPGRLEDLLAQGVMSLADVDLVVIDEADRMADMGFLPVVKRIIDQTHADRQTLLFSATLDGDVDVLIRRYQNDPARHEFESSNQDFGQLRHVFWLSERTDRRRLTGQILRLTGSAIVFTRTKHGADRLAKQLAQDGVTTAAIHGDRSQRQREAALRRFVAGEVQALVATDVAARGIHVDDVSVVIHFDQPATDKDYVHRSGRTGRAGADGLVVSLVAEAETRELQKLQRLLSLPQGLHDIDMALLTADELPAPRPVHGTADRAPASRPRNRGGSSRRTRAGGGGQGSPAGGSGQTSRGAGSRQTSRATGSGQPSRTSGSGQPSRSGGQPSRGAGRPTRSSAPRGGARRRTR